MKKTWKRLCTGFLALATVVTALPTTPVHAESKQYWTESAERVGIIEKVMNDGSIGSTFNEGYMKVEGETAYCIDINTDFKNGYKTRADASSRMSVDQISDVALSLEYVKQYGEAHKELNYKQVYLLEQCVVWQRLSVHLGWQCDNVRASYNEIPKATQDEVFSGAKAFVKENKGRYECGGYIYSGEGQELGQFWAKLNVGNAKLQKTSSNTSITDGNGNYSVAGATYGVFSDKDCTKQLATLTTDENGKVIRGGVKIQKRDLETGDTKPQGSATLKDTAFDIISLNDNAVLVEGKLYKKNEVVKTIRTDIEGIASTSSDLLPYGKFRIVESEAPDGYLTDGAKPIDFTITENGKIVDLTDEAHSIYNQIKRGDIEGVKIGAGTHKRLADVPFRITSKTTGENHVVVTDDNGQFSTSADWASHKHNTNAGKTSEDGVWFGTSEPDDSKGALPYDTYIIEEMRCDSNKGFELIPPFEIVVSRNNLVIDLGTLTDEYEKEISIHTTATSKDGEKTILAGKEVTIVDTVKLDGLTKGTKYQLKGWQMLKEENAELIIDGKRVENDYTFVADDEEMKVEISYTFNASALGGKNLVTFEELYDLSNPDEPVKVAEHKDIEDDGQTVLITERIIKIHTTATDKDGKKEIEAGKEVTIIDTVTLEGLEVGTQYKLVGWQMLKEENAELLINGKRVESDYTFTADSETMKVEVAFTFDATSLDGKQLVTFEELYDLSNPDEPKKVTEHKDIEDKGQTITFKEKPEEPEKPETPPTPEKPNRPSDSPKTGDNTNLYGLLALLMTSGAGLAGIFFYKRRKMKKS